jgi:hypothetical protein
MSTATELVIDPRRRQVGQGVVRRGVVRRVNLYTGSCHTGRETMNVVPCDDVV